MVEYTFEFKEKIKIGEKEPDKYSFASSLVKDHTIIRSWHHNLKVEFLKYLLDKFKNWLPTSVYSPLEKESKDLRIVKRGEKTLYTDYNDIVDVLIKLPETLDYLVYRGVDLVELKSKINLLKYVAKGQIYTADLMNLLNSVFELLWRAKWGALREIYEPTILMEEIKMIGFKEPVSIYNSYSDRIELHLGIGIQYSDKIELQARMGLNYSEKIQIYIGIGTQYNVVG